MRRFKKRTEQRKALRDREWNRKRRGGIEI